MTNPTDGNANKVRHERVTFRVEPDYHKWLQAVAAYLQIDKSKLIRMAILEWVNHHERDLSPRLVRWLKEWRERPHLTAGQRAVVDEEIANLGKGRGLK